MAGDNHGISGLANSDLRVRKENTAERAAGVLRDLIVRGEIDAGQPLRETELAPALGVSRNTIREALRILARESLVAPSHRNVYTVVQVSAGEVPDIFRVRTMIEFAAVRAIREDDAGLDLTELTEALTALSKLHEDAEWWQVVETDVAFHTAMVAQAKSPRLSSMYKQLEGEIRLCLGISGQFPLTIEELVDEHTQLLVALERREFDRFEELLSTAIKAASGRVVGTLTAVANANGDGSATA